MKKKSLSTTLLGLLLLVVELKTSVGMEDLCSFGSLLNSGVINHEWTFQGTDPDNDNKPYWYSNCYTDVAIEWGMKDFGAQQYIIKPKDSNNTFYAYCWYQNYPPETCPEWQIWDGTSVVLSTTNDPTFTMDTCSNWEAITDCSGTSYMESLGLTGVNDYCISNAQYRTIIEGTYEYGGCDRGVPWFNNVDLESSTSVSTIHYDFCFRRWYLGPNITTTEHYAYCIEYDFLDCTGSENGLEEYALISAGPPAQFDYLLDQQIVIEECDSLQPTLNPTIPTVSPTQYPSNDPTVRPTLNPTLPTVIPTYKPSILPTLMPSIVPTRYPTISNAIDICSFGYYSDDNFDFVNARWSYQGYDSNGNEYWSSDCDDGYYFKYLNDKYQIVDDDDNSYASCEGGSGLIASQCSTNWRIDGSVRSDFYAISCDDLINGDCTEDYVEDTYSQIEISGSTVNTNLDGDYSYGECNDGFPYYFKAVGGIVAIHFEPECGSYVFSDASLSDSADVYAICESNDPLDCSGDLQVENSMSVYETDSSITIIEVTTDAPNPSPTQVPSDEGINVDDDDDDDGNDDGNDDGESSEENTSTVTPVGGDDSDDDDDDGQNTGGEGDEVNSKGEGGSDSLFDSTESTIYLLAGFGISLLICWVLCCFWYVRRRKKRLADGVALSDGQGAELAKIRSIDSMDTAISPASPSAGSPASVNSNGEGVNMAETTTEFPETDAVAHQHQQAAMMYAQQGQQTHDPHPHSVSSAADAAAKAKLQQQQQQLAQLQHTLRMQQMQQQQLHQQMMQQQMAQQMQAQMMNINMMPQPQVGFQQQQSQQNVMMMQNQLSNQSAHQLNGMNQQGVIPPPGLPTNPAAAAFTNGVAAAFVPGAGGGEEDSFSSDHQNDDLFDGRNAVPYTTNGGPPPPSFN